MPFEVFDIHIHININRSTTHTRQPSLRVRGGEQRRNVCNRLSERQNAPKTPRTVGRYAQRIVALNLK
jgi:hypothetical protein